MLEENGMNVIGKNLKKYREKAGLSQQELAKHMAVTRQTISNWERGVSQPDLDSIFLLANEFQVDVTEIIYGQKPNDEFQTTQGQRIKRTTIIGIIFLITVLLSVFLIPILYNFKYIFIILPYSIASVTLLPFTYAIGAVFALSLISIWIDFRLSNHRIYLFMIIFPLVFVFLYLSFMLTSILGQFIGLYLDDVIYSDLLFNWLFEHPVIFIIPGAMLFFGFNRKPQPPAEPTQPVQEADVP